jgi:hypothetical protein
MADRIAAELSHQELGPIVNLQGRKLCFLWMTIAVIAVLLLTYSCAKAHTRWYCKPLFGLERSCSSVQFIVKRFGSARAEGLARKCGATEDEIRQAKVCLR